MTPHHVGYLVKNMEKAIKEFICLGYEKRSEIVFDSARGIDICFMEKMGLSVELVTPAGDNSVVTSLIKKTGSSPYHICYAVKDLKKSDEELRARGYIPIGEPLPAPALGSANSLSATPPPQLPPFIIIGRWVFWKFLRKRKCNICVSQ